MGAKLRKNDELQEWLDKQEALKKNPMLIGSDVFTYRTVQKNDELGELEHEIMQNKAIMEAVQKMRQSQINNQASENHTRASSMENNNQKRSFFEKIERLKLVIKSAHSRINLDLDRKSAEDIK